MNRPLKPHKSLVLMHFMSIRLANADSDLLSSTSEGENSDKARSTVTDNENKTAGDSQINGRRSAKARQQLPISSKSLISTENGKTAKDKDHTQKMPLGTSKNDGAQTDQTPAPAYISEGTPMSLHSFHLFLWLAVSSNGHNSITRKKIRREASESDNGISGPQRKGSLHVNVDSYDRLLDKLKNHIIASNQSKRKAYERCPRHTLQEVENRLEQFKIEMESLKASKKFGQQTSAEQLSHSPKGSPIRNDESSSTSPLEPARSEASDGRNKREFHRNRPRWHTRRHSSIEEHNSDSLRITRRFKNWKDFVQRAKDLFQFFFHYTRRPKWRLSTGVLCSTILR